jgi:HemY protein
VKFLFKVIIVLFVGVSLGVLAFKDPGYVLISRAPWTLETSAAFLLVMLVTGFGVLYYLIRFVSTTATVGRSLRNWQQQRRARRARRALTRGLIKLAERQWHAAEKDLTRTVADSETPLLNYLAAASAAQGQGENERRDQYLRLAHESMPEADVAVGLTQAELQLRQRQMEQALATLTHLRQLAPRHTHVLKLLMQLYLDLSDWSHLKDLLPELRKRHVVDEQEYASLESRVYSQLLNSAISSQVREVILNVWSQVPKRLRPARDFAAAYAGYLMKSGQMDEAEKLLRDALNRQWDSQLVLLYSSVDSSNKTRQLAHAEKWLAERDSDPYLLLALGRLSEANTLWGKARSCYESSLAIRPLPETFKALGDLAAHMETRQPAEEYYQKGLALALAHRVARSANPPPD